MKRHHRHDAYWVRTPPSQHADRGAGTRDGPVGAEGFGPFPGVVLKRDGQDRQGRRSHERGKGTLQRSGPEEHGLIDSRAAKRRGSCEADQSHDEHPAPAPEVGDTTTEQQQPAKGERIGRDDPLSVGDRDME